MTFVDRFMSFQVALSSPEAGLDAKLRMKIAQHPDESLEHINARLFAYCHAYEDGLELTPGLFDSSVPAFWRRSLTEDILLWGEVGVPLEKRFSRSQRFPPSVRRLLYLYEPQQRIELFDLMKRLRVKERPAYTVWEIDHQLVARLASSVESRAHWSMTTIDHVIYLDVDGVSYETALREVDVWGGYHAWIAACEES